MYRHEKTPENSTALLTSVTGFEENPTEIFLAEMQNIVPEMQDLPFYHKGIECFCPKFVLFEAINSLYNCLTKHLLSPLVVLKMYRNI